MANACVSLNCKSMCLCKYMLVSTVFDHTYMYVHMWLCVCLSNCSVIPVHLPAPVTVSWEGVSLMAVPQQRKPKSCWHAPGTPCTGAKLFLTESNASHWVLNSRPAPLTSSPPAKSRTQRQITLERESILLERRLPQSVNISLFFFFFTNEIEIIAVRLKWTTLNKV